MPWRKNLPSADSFALMEAGKWYGVVRFLPNGKDIVLRDHPTDDPFEALAIARRYAADNSPC